MTVLLVSLIFDSLAMTLGKTGVLVVLKLWLGLEIPWSSFDIEQNCLCYETSDLTENQLNLSDRTRLLAFKCGETRLKIILEHISFCGILAPNIFNLKKWTIHLLWITGWICIKWNQVCLLTFANLFDVTVAINDQIWPKVHKSGAKWHHGKTAGI